MNIQYYSESGEYRIAGPFKTSADMALFIGILERAGGYIAATTGSVSH